MDRSAALESEGKWLDAYANYFYWLQAIDPNNHGYSEHVEEILDRAGIAASFQDSPCESRKERFEGVEKRMLEKTIDVLDQYYVKNIDYAQMASKAVKRCDLLAQVLVTTCAKDPNMARENSLRLPDPAKVTAWSAALAGLRDEVERASQGFGKGNFLAILDKVLSLNDTTVELPRQPLIAHFAEAALGVLDPYTVIVWPRQVQDFEKQMTNEFTGIGIEISRTKGLLTVASLLPDTPAYKYGLDAGDVIELVDGVPTKDMSLLCAVKKITGPKGTKVSLTIRRPTEGGPRTILITRDRIIVPTRAGLAEDGGRQVAVYGRRGRQDRLRADHQLLRRDGEGFRDGSQGTGIERLARPHHGSAFQFRGSAGQRGRDLRQVPLPGTDRPDAAEGERDRFVRIRAVRRRRTRTIRLSS